MKKPRNTKSKTPTLKTFNYKNMRIIKISQNLESKHKRWIEAPGLYDRVSSSLNELEGQLTLKGWHLTLFAISNKKKAMYICNYTITVYSEGNISMVKISTKISVLDCRSKRQAVHTCSLNELTTHSWLWRQYLQHIHMMMNEKLSMMLMLPCPVIPTDTSGRNIS